MLDTSLGCIVDENTATDEISRVGVEGDITVENVSVRITEVLLGMKDKIPVMKDCEVMIVEGTALRVSLLNGGKISLVSAVNEVTAWKGEMVGIEKDSAALVSEDDWVNVSVAMATLLLLISKVLEVCITIEVSVLENAGVSVGMTAVDGIVSKSKVVETMLVRMVVVVEGMIVMEGNPLVEKVSFVVTVSGVTASEEIVLVGTKSVKVISVLEGTTVSVNTNSLVKIVALVEGRIVSEENKSSVVAKVPLETDWLDVNGPTVIRTGVENPLEISGDEGSAMVTSNVETLSLGDRPMLEVSSILIVSVERKVDDSDPDAVGV